MYTDKEHSTWLSSPNAYGYYCLCYIDIRAGLYGSTEDARKFEPIVSLKPAIRIEIEE